MDELKAIFGDEALDYATFEAKLAEAKDVKLVNLKQGGYVDKAKYEKLSGDFEKWKADNDVSKYADYDAIKAELEQLRTEKADAELKAKLLKAHVDNKFVDFVMYAVKPLVTEQKDFDACLKDYLKDNPQYVVAAQETPKQYVQFGSSIDLNGTNNQRKSPNDIVNAFVRGAVKK